MVKLAYIRWARDDLEPAALIDSREMDPAYQGAAEVRWDSPAEPRAAAGTPEGTGHGSFEFTRGSG